MFRKFVLLVSGFSGFYKGFTKVVLGFSQFHTGVLRMSAFLNPKRSTVQSMHPKPGTLLFFEERGLL